MAKKVKKPTPPSQGADDLATLLPQRELTLDGRTIVLHEITLYESLVHRPLLAPLITGLGVLRQTGMPGIDALLDLLAQHHAEVTELVAISCGQPVDWVRTLKSEDGEALLFAWWVVNAGFFIRQVMRPIIQAQLDQAKAQTQAGQISSLPSSPTATTPEDSLTTPAVN